MTVKYDAILGQLREKDAVDLTGYVPYSGATQTVDLGSNVLIAGSVVNSKLIQSSTDGLVYTLSTISASGAWMANLADDVFGGALDNTGIFFNTPSTSFEWRVSNAPLWGLNLGDYSAYYIGNLNVSGGTLSLGGYGGGITFNGPTNVSIGYNPDDGTYIQFYNDILMRDGGTNSNVLYFKGVNSYIMADTNEYMHFQVGGGKHFKFFGGHIDLGDQNTDPTTIFFDGGTNTGYLNWQGAKDYFEFTDDLFIPSGETIKGDALELPHVIKKVASANVRNSHNAEASTTSQPYIKMKTITLTNGLVGQERFLFDAKNDDNATPVYARIYRNGSILGSELNTTSSTYSTQSEDITQTWNPGDTAEIWGHTNDGSAIIYVRNFQIAYDDSPTVAVAGINS